MKTKLKSLIVGVGSAMFAIACYFVFGWAIVVIGLFNLILVTLLEIIVQTNNKFKRMAG
jgi:hypothetical protein